MDEKAGMSATQWRHMYFVGISKQVIYQIDLSEPQISGLLSMINLNAVISTGKGTTPWLAMYALVQANDPEALNLIANGKSRIHAPSTFIQNAFGDHINWPADMLSKYDLSLGEYRMFAIPFLVHEDVRTMGSLSQSIKAPDGSLEIFGVHEMVEGNPEALLKDCAELAGFIKEHRADALQ